MTAQDWWTSTSSTRRYKFLLLGSLLLHLIFTPVAGWVGALSLLFSMTQEPASPDEDDEAFDEIPVELFEFSEPAPKLPEEDPIALIEEWLEPALGEPNSPAPPKPAPTTSSAPSATTPPPAPPSATAPPKPVPSASAAPQASSLSDPGAGGAPPAAAPASSAKPKPHRPMHNPLALKGAGAKITKQKPYVALVVYLDRVREHPAGKRIAALLPKLPQWRDFFASGTLNPIDDFERIHLVGPSFSNSSQVVAQLQYRTSTKAIKAAVDALVKRRGQWLKGTRYSVARAFADRAPRSFIIREPNLLVIVPPQLEAKMLALPRTAIPGPRGKEAMVARTQDPHKPFARLGLVVPKSIKYATLMLTPLPNGAVLAELEAEDASEQAAEASAKGLSAQINAAIDLASGLSSLLGQLGIGAGVRLPRVQLVAEKKLILGRVVLSYEQLSFILDRAERHLVAPVYPRSGKNRGYPRSGKNRGAQ